MPDAMDEEAVATAPERPRIFPSLSSRALADPQTDLLADPEAGWPPRFAGMGPGEPSPASTDRVPLSPDDVQNAAVTVRHNDRVRELLLGRSELLGVHLVNRPAMREGVRAVLVVDLFNYATNVLVEAEVEIERDGCIVSEISIKEPWEHPESPTEMALAIRLARGHAPLDTLAADLEAHAILRVPINDPHDSAYKHRGMHVMFTERREAGEQLPVLYFAWVDLVTQQVLAAGESP